MKKYSLLILFLIIITSYTNAQKSIVGDWDGRIKMLSMDLNFHLNIKASGKEYKAFFSIPSQKLKDFLLPVFTFSKGKVHFELTSEAGVAKFDGVMKADSIKGIVIQAGVGGEFFLGRGPMQIVEEQKGTKPEEPLPYSEEEVAFKSGRILIAGTLSIPKEEKKYPAVILLTGNGPQNRDEEIYGFKVFQKIADHLVRKGIAVLRYDDRGIGGSTGKTMTSTTEDFAEDAKAAIDFLKKQPNIDLKNIGLIGHSEGGVIASIATINSNDVAFLVIMSGAGVAGGDVLLEQQKLILKAGGVSDSLITQNLDLQKKINSALRDEKDLNDIRNDIQAFAEKDYASLSPDIRKSIRDKNVYINSTVQTQIQVFNNPWFMFYVKYNPALVYEKIHVPVLLLFGELDLQVPTLLNKPKIEEAFAKGGNKNFKSYIFPKTNHLFQEAKTGSPGEYSSLKKEFVPGFLETISNWILKTIK
jgi:uncharacterized protein